MLDTSTLSNGSSKGINPLNYQKKNLISYKVLIIGEPNIGKTCLKHRYICEKFLSIDETTIGLDYQEKIVQVTSNEKIKLNIWDTAGSEKFHSIAQSFFTNCDGIILCFDLTEAKTFLCLDSWIDYINTYVDLKVGNANNNNDLNNENNLIDKKKKYKNIFEYNEEFNEDEEGEDFEEEEEEKEWIDEEQFRPIIILAGTKGDLEDKRKVSDEDIRDFSQKMKCEYFETSALDGRGVDDLFFYLAKEMFEKKIVIQDNNDRSKRFRLGEKFIQGNPGGSMSKCC